MQKDWPSLSCPSTNGSKIWKHEWTTRGTCSVATLDQHSYFEAALNMKEKINILQILKNAGKSPYQYSNLIFYKLGLVTRDVIKNEKYCTVSYYSGINYQSCYIDILDKNVHVAEVHWTV